MANLGGKVLSTTETVNAQGEKEKTYLVQPHPPKKALLPEGVGHLKPNAFIPPCCQLTRKFDTGYAAALLFSRSVPVFFPSSGCVVIFKGAAGLCFCAPRPLRMLSTQCPAHRLFALSSNSASSTGGP